MNAEWAEPPKDQGRSLAAPGVQLATQREAMGLSVEQIADQLKLAPRQVVALEAGDFASLPNMAVVRGFVRAYAKVVKLDPMPLVAMIEVGGTPTPSHDAPPLRRELPATTFSESRFPTLTERSAKPTGLIIGAAVAVIVAAAGAYAWHSGMISPAMFSRADKAADASAAASASSAAASAPAAETPAAAAADASAPLATTLVKPGQESATLLSPSVPLISVPPPAGTAPTPAPGAAGTSAATGTTPTATAPAPTTTAAVAPAAGTPAPGAPAPAATGVAHALVLKVNADSWITIRRSAGAPLISRLVKAGSTETFDIKEASLLIVGNPGGVQATLDGAPLALPPLAGSTTSRVNIK